MKIASCMVAEYGEERTGRAPGRGVGRTCTRTLTDVTVSQAHSESHAQAAIQNSAVATRTLTIRILPLTPSTALHPLTSASCNSSSTCSTRLFRALLILMAVFARLLIPVLLWVEVELSGEVEDDEKDGRTEEMRLKGE